MEIRRELYGRLKAHLSQKEITLLVGARQVGKTTLIRTFVEELQNKKKKVLFFNLDIEQDAQYFSSQGIFLKKVELEWGKEGGYIFIDEIQRKENAGIFLKGLYDMDLPYKFIVTGSGSLELKEKIHESLIGRKRMFELYTVSFKEFVDYKTAYAYSDRIEEYLSLHPSLSGALLEEYLNFGGYPRVVTEPTSQEKTLLLREIYQSYIEKDIVYLLNIERPESFGQMIRLLSSQTGRNLTFSTLANQTALSLPTLKKYLWYAEKTFSITLIQPFFRNPQKELTKSPQVYFHDLGFRNLALNLVGKMGAPETTGMVFQNFMYLLLREVVGDTFGSVYYWRTTDKAEVDFVLQIGERLIPIEVKYKELKRPSLSRAYRSFLKKYRPKQGYIINLSLSTELEVEESTVQFLPYFNIIDAIRELGDS